MKRKHLFIALLIVSLVLTFAACNETDDPPVESTTAATTTEAPTEAPTEEVTEAPTEEVTEVPTEEATEAPTAEVTETPTEDVTDEPEETQPEEVKKYREEWDEDDPANPFYNLIPVGTSYDGRTTCYDGRYDFGYAVCRTSDGEYFYSVQEAVWHLEEMGGGSILMTEHTDICLKLEFPDDYCDYRLYFQFLNVDFVFNYGVIYDDDTPNAEGVNGYAYYADLYVLDGVSTRLGDTHVWIIQTEDFTESGRYLIIDEVSDDPDYWFTYQYEMDGDMDEWMGLPMGEYIPE